jgi:hypothetical protein
MSRTDVSKRTPNGTFEQWIEVMKIQADELEDSNDFDPRELLAQANEAATFEEAVEILNGGGTKSGKDLVGIVHTVKGYTLRRSDTKFAGQGLDLGVFAVVQAVIDGEETVYTTGASNVLSLLWQADKFEKFPLKAVITARETTNGELLSLKPLFN